MVTPGVPDTRLIVGSVVSIKNSQSQCWILRNVHAVGLRLYCAHFKVAEISFICGDFICITKVLLQKNLLKQTFQIQVNWNQTKK